MKQPATWESETLFVSGDEYFDKLLKAIDQANTSLEIETYIFEKGVLGDRVVAHLCRAAVRGVRIRLIVDGWGSPNFYNDYYKELRRAGVHVRFFRVIPWILKKFPGDPDNIFRRLLWRWKSVNRGNHRKFCLIDNQELWMGSFNISDVHLREVYGADAWKDIGVCVRGKDLKYARRAFIRAFRGWRAINWPAKSPHLLLLNDSYLHKRRTRLEHLSQMRKAKTRIWLATPYFLPVGKVFRLLRKAAKNGLDVRLIVPDKNDVWIMKWMSWPLIKSLTKRGVQVFIYQPRFSHQKVFITDDWVCIGSTNLNHRSFLHDLEMDVVITRDENKIKIIEGYLRDQSLSEAFDSSAWAHLPLWKRVLSSVFLVLKYFS